MLAIILTLSENIYLNTPMCANSTTSTKTQSFFSPFPYEASIVNSHYLWIQYLQIHLLGEISNLQDEY